MGFLSKTYDRYRTNQFRTETIGNARYAAEKLKDFINKVMKCKHACSYQIDGGTCKWNISSRTKIYEFNMTIDENDFEYSLFLYTKFSLGSQETRMDDEIEHLLNKMSRNITRYLQNISVDSNNFDILYETD